MGENVIYRQLCSLNVSNTFLSGHYFEFFHWFLRSKHINSEVKPIAFSGMYFQAEMKVNHYGVLMKKKRFLITSINFKSAPVSSETLTLVASGPLPALPTDLYSSVVPERGKVKMWL